MIGSRKTKIMKIKDFFRSGYMVLCIGCAIIFLYPVLVFPKGELELLVNRFHFPVLDFIFKYLTHLGDGSLLALLFIGALFYNYHTAIFTAFSIVIQSLLVTLFKRWIFNGLVRPVAFFDQGIALNFVDGVNVHSANTFPSGHTATAFALFAILSIMIGNREGVISTLLFLLAFVVGVSRVYLLQHFVVDVYFGAIIGMVSVIAGLFLIDIFFNKKKQEALKTHSLRFLINKKRV